MGTEEHQQIGTVAERTGLSIQTLRHWDKAGLVEPSARSAGGFRLYTDTDVERLRTVRRMKPLGFTLEDMKALLDALDAIEDDDDPEQVRVARVFLAECVDQVDQSIERLHRHLDYARELREVLRDRS